MPSRHTESIFLLIKSLEKGEKRNFKLYVKRNSESGDLIIIELFDLLDRMSDYNEAALLKKTTRIKKSQLSNLKAHLFRQILASLRLIKEEDNIDLQLHEQMDFARILYNKGMYMQSLKMLERLKETARAHEQLTYLQQALFFEKKIETLYITRSLAGRAGTLSREADQVQEKLSLVNQLSNLSLQLYSWYLENGHARNRSDFEEVERFFAAHLPAAANAAAGFYERLYLYQSNVWYAFIRQDFVQYYRYSRRWVELFTIFPSLRKTETAAFIKGWHNWMNAEFYLLRPGQLSAIITAFEKEIKEKYIEGNDNNRILAYQYLYAARINLYFLQGRFDKGVLMVPFLEKMLKQYRPYLDTHRVMVFYYKIACLYFGSGDYAAAIDYLNRIIDDKSDFRNDLHCYSRLLHLICHYELGNDTIIEHLIKTVYRYMAKMNTLSQVEEILFAFLRRAFHLHWKTIRVELEQLYKSLQQFEGNPQESRSFLYLDVLSWLESKLQGKNVQDVIRGKYAERK